MALSIDARTRRNKALLAEAAKLLSAPVKKS